MARKAAIDYKDFIEFAAFLGDWATAIDKAEYINILSAPDVVAGLTEFVADEIEQSTDGHAFGRFMAERTYVEAVATDRGITFHIKGYTEREMLEMGKPSRLSGNALEGGKDYNLWDFYEFQGGSVSTNALPTGNGKQKIVKDVGGPVVIRQGTGGTQELVGRRGLIRALLPQIKAQLMVHILDILKDGTKLTIADAMVESVGNKKIKGLSRIAKKQAARQAVELGIDIAKLGSVAVSSGGTLRERGAGGKFIKSPVSKIRVNVKK